MTRQTASTLLALTFAGLVGAAAGPAFAGPHYQAQPAVAPASAKLVLRDVVWNCGDAGCVAGQSNSRPAIVCAVLAKEVGLIRSFAVAGQALSAEELDKCNARVARQIAKRQQGEAARVALRN